MIEALKETRARTIGLVNDLSEAQSFGPRLQIVNPLRWEIAHVAWFQEFWVLRHLGGQPPILKTGDELYDSARVAHDARWNLRLLERDETLAYMKQVLEQVIEQTGNASHELTDADGYDQEYFLNLVLLHEQMHDEAITYTRQTLSYPPPAIGIGGKQVNDVAVVNKIRLADQNEPLAQTDNCLRGDSEIPGGKFTLGSASEQRFVFDNEQQAHEVEIAPFAICKTAVTNGEFKNFVEDGGYGRSELWTADGWQWRTAERAECPVYWRREGSTRWLRRNFDEWGALDEHLPIIHVNWHEANAYCRWANRRLPTEAEWEMAASGEPAANGRGLSGRKRRYPWGDDSPSSERANLDWLTMGCVPVDALPAGDSAFGCRQMIGNVWEWTASDFHPYPGFVAGPYKEYSAPWFGDHKVLRGGCWVTRSRLIHNHYRNFYTPDRPDIMGGLPHVCALEPGRMRIGIVTPAPPDSRSGNRITAFRWARILRRLGNRVSILETYDGKSYDLLVALHARKSHSSIVNFQRQNPAAPVIVALTGTDLYRDIRTNHQARASLDIATRIVVLQPKAIEALQPSLRDKTRVIYQSVDEEQALRSVKGRSPKATVSKREGRSNRSFDVCVIGHLRFVKDPFRTAMASRLLPSSSGIRVLQVGGAMTNAMEAKALQETRVNRRYRWLGEQKRTHVFRVLASSHLCVISSRMEGGANVLSEAITASVPVLASRIDGNVGILGVDYPGYFDVGSTRELAQLLARAETSPEYLTELRDRVKSLSVLFAPAREQNAWKNLCKEVFG